MSKENDNGNYDYHDSDDEKAPEIEEYDSDESKEDYINEMQRLIDKMKNDKSDQ